MATLDDQTAIAPAHSGQAHNPLGEELGFLRKRGRLSQRALGKLSGVSWTMIQLIEGSYTRASKPAKPSPETLQRLAHGLALQPPDNLVVDEALEEQFYNRLMVAAGYLKQDRQEAADVLALERDITRFAEDERAGIAFSSLAADWQKLDPRSQQFVLDAIRQVTGRELNPS